MKSSLFFVLGVMALLMSCQGKEDLEKEPPRILIIGNSITYHPPDLSIGWEDDWGMAASRPELDYVSLLTQRMREKDPSIEVIRENVYPFERHFDELDWDAYSHLKDFEADLLVIRLGENVDTEKMEGDNLKDALQGFVGYLSGGRAIDVIVTTTFWENAPVSDQLTKAGEESGWEVVQLSDLGEDDQYMALGEFENYAVSRHPNDLGMAEIAGRIHEAVKGLLLEH